MPDLPGLQRPINFRNARLRGLSRSERLVGQAHETKRPQPSAAARQFGRTKLKAEFKVRSAERDRKNDDLRIERLDKVLEDVISEVRRERTGLRARYENSADAADLPLDKIAAGVKPTGAKSETETSLAQLVSRLKKLDAQEHVLQQMQQDLARLQGLSAD